MQTEKGEFADAAVWKSGTRSSKRYEHFGEVIRYLTLDELQQFFDSIDSYNHKLMFQVTTESKVY